MRGIKNILLAGFETEKSIDLLISFTDMESENMRGALVDMLVKGHQPKVASALNGVVTSNLYRDVKRLNEVANKIDQYLEDNYNKYRNGE